MHEREIGIEFDGATIGPLLKRNLYMNERDLI